MIELVGVINEIEAHEMYIKEIDQINNYNSSAKLNNFISAITCFVVCFGLIMGLEFLVFKERTVGSIIIAIVFSLIAYIESLSTAWKRKKKIHIKNFPVAYQYYEATKNKRVISMYLEPRNESAIAFNHIPTNNVLCLDLENENGEKTHERIVGFATKIDPSVNGIIVNLTESCIYKEMSDNKYDEILTAEREEYRD